MPEDSVSRLKSPDFSLKHVLVRQVRKFKLLTGLKYFLSYWEKIGLKCQDWGRANSQ